MRRGFGLAAAVLVAVALAGCGGSGQSTAQRIATYLAAVNRVERQLDAPVGSVDAINRRLAARGTPRSAAGSTALFVPTTSAGQQRALQRDEAQILAVGRRLSVLPAPTPARRLRGLLVTLVDHQARLTAQTRRLVGFIPGFTRSLRPLGPAIVHLERVLAVTSASGSVAVQAVYAAKVAALRGFVHTLTGIISSLRRLAPPASSIPTARSEARSLTRMRSAAAALAGDLAAGHMGGLSPVLDAFDRAAAIPGSREAQVAERAAIEAYDRQVSQLGRIVAAADRERLRLSQRYG